MIIAHSKLQTPITLKHENYWNSAIEGMKAVVRSGTAHRAGAGARYRFAGKTGTAQVVGIKQGKTYNARRLSKKYHDHALFISFAPSNDPRIAVAVIVENGGGGSSTAAPIARKVMDYYLLETPYSPLFMVKKK
jgi:penicillin-binding protein 2